MELKEETHNVVVTKHATGSYITWYPKAELTGRYKAPIQARIEALLDEGKVIEVITDSGLARALSPSFSGQGIINSDYLKLKQVVMLPNQYYSTATKEEIDHAYQIQGRLIEFFQTLPRKRSIKCGSKVSRRNLSFEINGQWVRVPGLTVNFCQTHDIPLE